MLLTERRRFTTIMVVCHVGRLYTSLRRWKFWIVVWENTNSVHFRAVWKNTAHVQLTSCSPKGSHLIPLTSAVFSIPHSNEHRLHIARYYGFMLTHRLRHWRNLKPPLGQRIVFGGIERMVSVWEIITSQWLLTKLLPLTALIGWYAEPLCWKVRISAQLQPIVVATLTKKSCITLSALTQSWIFINAADRCGTVWSEYWCVWFINKIKKRVYWFMFLLFCMFLN